MMELNLDLGRGASRKQLHVQRLERALDAHGELAFLQDLAPDQLSLLWSKVARQALQQGRKLRHLDPQAV